MKVITLDGLKTFLDELMGKITREVYSKSESDNKFARKTDAYTKAESDARFATKDALAGKQDKIKNLTFTEGMDSQLRRPYVGIETTHPIVRFNRPLSVNGQLIPNNAEVESTVKIIGGDLFQPKGDYATKADLAQLGGGVPRGTWFAPGGRASWIVPDGVRVVKITWALETTFFKVNPDTVFRTEIRVTVDSPELWSWTLKSATCSPNSDADFASIYDLLSRHSTRDTATSEFAISWSPEINAHAVDVDLTK